MKQTFIFGVLLIACIELISANGQAQPSNTSYTVQYEVEGVEVLPQGARNAISEALQSWPYPVSDNIFHIVNLRWETTWALGTVVTTANDVNGQMTTKDMLAFLVVKIESDWQAAIETTDKVQELLKSISDSVFVPDAKNAIFPTKQSVGISPLKGQQSNNYKFPWGSSIGFKTSRANYGWHDSKGNFGGTALDFYPVGVSNSTLLASNAGTITNICTNPNGIQSWIQIQTQNTTEKLLYVHVHKNTIPAGIKQGASVTGGTELGKMVEGNINENNNNYACKMWSEGTHVHLLFPTKPFVMDGYTFTTYSNGYLKVLDRNGNEVTQPFNTLYYSTQGQQNSACACNGTDPVLNCTIANGQSLNCTGRNSITLKDGFHAEQGSAVTLKP